MTEAQKKELRRQRFGSGLGGDTVHVNTIDALKLAQEEKEKRLARALKYGLNTKEIEEMKKKERAERFGLKTEQKGNQPSSDE